MGLARPFEETQPADAGQRERALDAAQSFLVDAPAGSGKTELLIQRYLKLLALVEAPEAVVAITFTVKAAAEMRTRVLEALARAAGEARPDSSHEALTWDLAAAVLERDRERRWDLRDHPARLRVQTIDALCASITRQMPWLSRFGAQPQVTEQAEELYREAARNLMAQLPDPLVVLLERLDNQVPALTELLVGMLARRDQWLRHVMRGTAREELESALRAVIREELSGLCRSVPAEWTDDLLDLARFAAANLRDSGRESDLAACHEMTELPGTRPEDVAVWRGIAALLLKANGDWRARPDVRTGFPSDQREAKRRYEEMLGEFCRGHEEFREALKKLKWLPDASYDAGQWRAMEALFELLPVAVAELQVVFAERGVVDFAEVALRASLALGTEEQPTDLALALDYRIQHLLVDEFQDTSLSQYRLLRLLTAGWEPGDGRTLFLVGDPMQSIYRFREAEVGLFLRARREGIGTVALEPLRLTVNFRSQAGIVDWVNRAFAEVFPSREEIATGAVTYSPSVAQHADEGMEGGAAVEVHPLFGRDAAAEAALVLELVRSARVEHPRGKTAILARARTHLPRILRVLEEAGLRYRAIEIDELSARPLIQDLLALTRALVHAGDRTAWLAVLRAPWCGLTLADLDALAGTNPYAAVWELMADESRLSADGQARLRRVRGVLAESLQLTRRVPLRNWVEGTWVRLGGPACLRNRTDEEDARGFFQLLDAVEEGGEAPDPHVLAERVERLFAAPDLEADESLQVLTIHKAKGLEFDTVIVPGLGRIPPVDDARLLAWL
ncbi:MAG TPA: UvrD-helicase domain-containing protein, partial [Bryobacteraceae bacterium]|nr:UvrD-helicase domain-containing protein [Bryobacteraceae bacterium]